MSLILRKVYKAHQIHASANEDGINKIWTPIAIISWGKPHHYETIHGSDPCKTQDEAITKAVNLAIEWIDRAL